MRRDPGRLAVAAAGARLAYGELDRLASRLAGRLRRGGARPNQLVAVVMEKGWEQVVAVLGVLKSGAAYLPLDPDLPAERLCHLLEHGEVELALTQPWLDEELAWPADIEHFRVDADGGEEGELADDGAPPAALQGLDDLAYVIFTSGSTGLPKGVCNRPPRRREHRSWTSTGASQVGPGDRVLALSSLSFDLSVYDIFGLLAAGGCVVHPRAHGAAQPGPLARADASSSGSPCGTPSRR